MNARPRAPDEPQRLEALRSYDLLDTSPEPALDDLTALTARVCEAPISLISLVDGQRQWCKSKVGISLSETPRAASFCAHAILQRDVFVVPDAALDARFAYSPCVTGDAAVRFYAGAPLVTVAGHALGTLCVMDYAPRPWSTTQSETLRALARQVVAQLDLRRQARESNRLAAIVESSGDAIIGKDLDGIVTNWNAGAERIFGYSAAEIVGTSILRLIPEDRWDEESHILAEIRRGASVNHFETVRRTADGRLLDVSITASPIKDDDGRLVGASKVARDITKRKRAETALREREEQLRLYAEHSPVAVAMLDHEMTYLVVSDRWMEEFHPGEPSIIGQSHRGVFPNVAQHWISVHQRCLAGAVEKCQEEPYTRADGTTRWIRWEVRPWCQADGSIGGIIIFCEDLSERKETEAALRGARDRAQRYLDMADVILLALDLEGGITAINKKGCDLLGWSESELLGQRWVDRCLPPRIRSNFAQKFDKLIAGDLAVVENPILTKSGEERLIEWRNRALRDEAGQVVGTFSSGTDVTERNQAIDALRTAEERMRFALQSAEVGIWDMNYVSGALKWSETLEAHYGLEPGAFDGTFDAFVERVHPDDRASLLETIGTAMRSGADFSTEHRSVSPDGQVRRLRGAGRILLGEAGQPVRGVGISLDITAQHTLEAQYQQAQKMEAVGRLAGGVAHDFNNLLTAILGYCELVLDNLRPGDPLRADITQIQKAGTTAAALTRQLLAFSRKQIIEPALLDMNQVVSGMRGMLERLIGEDVTIVLDLGLEPAMLTADRGQLEQILLNLAVNARDAMPGGGTLTIETALVELDEHYAAAHFAVTPGPFVVLTVTDTGSGLTPDAQTHLFEPFFTTKDPGKGTGLGLATVHGVVTRSGGSVDVHSEVGKGTSFKVYFPRTDASVAVVEAPPAPRPRKSAHTVLVVEDAEGLGDLTRRLLQRQGYTVLVAANAGEALRVFEQHSAIDVVLTDVVMPGASGPELTQQLVEQRPSLKVVYMSGYTEEAIVHHGVLKPGIAFLHKPFTADALGRKLREVLD